MKNSLAISALLLLCVSLLDAQSKLDTLILTFTTIDVPGAGLTVVSGITLPATWSVGIHRQRPLLAAVFS